MKTLAIFLVLGFTWQVSNAYIGLPGAIWAACASEMSRLEATGHPKDEIMINSFACMIKKQHEDEHFIDVLKDLIPMDDEATEEQKIKMLETLTTCNTNAGDITKLLNCINVTTPPFDHLIFKILNTLEVIGGCNPKCQVTIVEMYRLINKRKQKVEEQLEVLNEQKLGCMVACRFDETFLPNSAPFWEELLNRINKSEKVDENQKKEMLETVNRCKTQVAELNDKTHEMIKCVNMFKPPFAYIY